VRAAILTASIVDPERDAGARSIINLRDSFHRLGFETILLVENQNLEDTLFKFRADVIVVSRLSTMIRARSFRTELKTPLLYWAHDLHAKRISLAEELEGAPASASLAISFVEQLAISSADLAVFPTIEDLDAARRKYSVSNLEHHQWCSFSSSDEIAESIRENTLVFIGSPGHPPNFDGLRWFLENCWPLIHKLEGSVKLQVIGAWEDPDIFGEDYVDVEFLGQLGEDEVSYVMSKALIGISPLRFGAGLKRKSLQYLNSGLVLVSTDFGLQGLPRNQDNKSWLRANTKIDFVDAIVQLIQQSGSTKEIAKSGSEFVKRFFSEEGFDLGLVQILEKVEVL
jgi:glycosyltransferase involved in cell wall biosynthesis